jgi:DNA gyrase inhibitor GyrI
MKTLKTILLVIGIFVVIAAGFLGYMGYFSSPLIQEKEMGPYIVVGIDVTGPYSKSGQHMQEATDKLKAMGITTSRGIGIYYDDPKTTPAEKCRCLVGGIIDQKDMEKLKTVSLNGMRIDSIHSGKTVVVEFPIKNILSYMLGPMKVYPQISKHMSDKNYKPLLSFEIYDNDQKKITYVMQYTATN